MFDAGAVVAVVVAVAATAGVALLVVAAAEEEAGGAVTTQPLEVAAVEAGAAPAGATAPAAGAAGNLRLEQSCKKCSRSQGRSSVATHAKREQRNKGSVKENATQKQRLEKEISSRMVIRSAAYGQRRLP
jgi:hypothetical protein